MADEDVWARWAENVEGRMSVPVCRSSAGTATWSGLRRRPYRETFVILRGYARFTLGDEQCDGGPGDVLVAAPDTPHTFRVLGPGVYEAVHIHENERFVTEWLE